MNLIIKIVLGILALVFGLMLVSWVIGIVGTLLGYAFWLGLLAAVGYGGYRLFKKADNRYVGPGSAAGYIDERDYSLSWEEYDRKYLQK